MRRSSETATTVLPLPLASLSCWLSSGPALSRRRWKSIARDRLLNVWILALNRLYLGRWPTTEELQRCPSAQQHAVFNRLRTFMTVCGDAQAEYPLCPGRSGPELGACLFQLEAFCSRCPELQSGYLDRPLASFAEDPKLIDAIAHPELRPYSSLNAGRLRIVGEGKWDMQKYLDGAFWLPFQEPACLKHDGNVPLSEIPSFQSEDRAECLKLALLWDARGLLHLEPRPVQPGYFCKVFNAFKNESCDRQIGDRRLPNLSERHLGGPSKHLPQGQQLIMLHVPRFTHVLRGSVTDRRDFYHQARVTCARAKTNMLPFAYSQDELRSTKALCAYRERCSQKSAASRETGGDHLKGVTADEELTKKDIGADVFPCFRSLFQGDHEGVEFALEAHGQMLEGGGLLDESHRIRGHHVFPRGPNWQGLVIDDFFVISQDPVSLPAEKSFAMLALAQARRIYEQEDVLGSPEKDIAADTTFKAAGAEVRSDEVNARRGVIPVGAPFAKRIALATLSLRAATLPCVSAKLLSRLAGNWVSVLQYRKCLSSVITDMFKLVSQCHDAGDSTVLPLPRGTAQELTLLGVLAPLMFSNVACDYLGELYATDASLTKGAVTVASVEKETASKLWRSADKQGDYTHLDNVFHAALKHVGEADEELETPGPACHETPLMKQPLLYFDFVEFCGGSGKVAAALARRGRSVGPTFDLSDSRFFNLGCSHFLNWAGWMISENRIRSFMVEPPCTTFSPAAHPCVRSYREPLGFRRDCPKTRLGNLLALRALALLRIGFKHRRPCALEQSRLSKMAWLEAWRALLRLGFAEAVVASCAFGSPHRKEFRLLCYLLDVAFLDVRCPGNHVHVKIQGALTKPSAIYVDGVADHFAEAFHRTLSLLDSEERCDIKTQGLEGAFANDVMVSSNWKVSRAWSWKRRGHINVLEMASLVSQLKEAANSHAAARFAVFVDSAVCRGAITKGRSASYALMPGLQRACALQIVADLYPAWIFSPTRLNVADDPTRDSEVRAPLASVLGKGLAKVEAGLLPCGIRRFVANWIRLTLLASLLQPTASLSVDFALSLSTLDSDGLGSFFGGWFCLASFGVLGLLGFGGLLRRGGTLDLFGFGFCTNRSPRLGHHNPPKKVARVWSPISFILVAMVLSSASAMPLVPKTEAERIRMLSRCDIDLAPSRAVRAKTNDQRQVYLGRFRDWLWLEKRISLKFLLTQKPPDPERIAELLVDYGKQMFSAGKTYGVFSETINAVAAARPLVKRQLTSAWDLAFAWLADEPHQHHPAMPLSVLASMASVSILWGWPHVAAVLLLAWTGVMRIGEVLSATRAELVLPCDAAPGTTFLLVVIRQPKTRGRAAKHQAARVDQEDVIKYVEAVYKDAAATTPLWPYSASTLRKRFAQILRILGLPCEKGGGQRPFDLGSLRPGGATWILHETEDSELVRRRGRWLSHRVMEVYLQESFVTTFIEKLDAKSRSLVEAYAGGFSSLLLRAVSFLHAGVPPSAWYFLIRGAARPPQASEGNGVNGDNFSHNKG
eukprot:Skav215620  [mRNA]  locus=scaffold666:640257:644840:- [translate_table: standard]